MMVDIIYNEVIFNKNPFYNRERLISSIMEAKTKIKDFCRSISSQMSEESVNEFIYQVNGTKLIAKDEIHFIIVNDAVYCLITDDTSLSNVNKIAEEHDIKEYITVSSAPKFFEDCMKNKMFSLLLRDYDILNFSPEEYQIIKNILN